MKIFNVMLAVVVAAMCLADSALADPNYVDEVMADSPLAYYRFDDPNSLDLSTCKDSAGRCWKNGAYIGSGISLVSGIPGLPGDTAADFGTSDNDSVVDVYDGGGNEIANPGGVTRQTISIEAWMKSSDHSDYARLLQHNGAYDDPNCWGIGSHTSGYITMIGGNNTWYTGTGNVFDGEWHHIVVTYQPSGINDANMYEYVYIDGVGKWGNTVADANLVTTYSRLTIGAEGNRWYAYNEFHGLLDEIAIYDTVLSSTRVAAHYNAGIPEPATICLFGLGAVALVRKRRR